jgi:hypothetical protein
MARSGSGTQVIKRWDPKRPLSAGWTTAIAPSQDKTLEKSRSPGSMLYMRFVPSSDPLIRSLDGIFMEPAFVHDELLGGDRELEEPVLAALAEPGRAGRVRAALLADDEEAGEEPGEVVKLLGLAPLFAEDDSRKAAHQAWIRGGW